MTSLADDTRWLDATDQAALVANRDATPRELLEAAIERIEALDPQLNAVVIRWFDHARDIADGTLPDGPFRGVPFLLKDLWAHFEGQLLSNGCQVVKDTAAPSTSDTTLVSRFRAAGLVIAGRTNSPEFGSLPTTEPLAWGPTRNPWDLSRSPGGSSGGAGAAVAAGMVPFAHASDGGGSIRIPASACGLVGLKPSQGRITLGPFRDESNLGVELCVSRSVRDTAALLDAVHGPGIGDTVIAQAPERPYVDELQRAPGRLRIGLLDHNPRGGDVDPECVVAVRAAAVLLESLGHTIELAYPAPMADPSFGQKFSALWSTNMGAACARIEDAIGRPLEPGDVEPVNMAQAEFARRFSAVDLAMAQAANVEYRRAIQAWWTQGWDLLLTPTLAARPVQVGTFANDPQSPMTPLFAAGGFVPFTPAFNASGQPAISLPLHWSADGLPIGVQLVAAYGREDILLRMAAQVEQAQPWAHRRPPLS